MLVKWTHTPSRARFSPVDDHIDAYHRSLSPFLIPKPVVKLEKPIRTCEYAAMVIKQLKEKKPSFLIHTFHNSAFLGSKKIHLADSWKYFCSPAAPYQWAAQIEIQYGRINLKWRDKTLNMHLSPLVCLYSSYLLLHSTCVPIICKRWRTQAVILSCYFLLRLWWVTTVSSYLVMCVGFFSASFGTYSQEILWVYIISAVAETVELTFST